MQLNRLGEPTRGEQQTHIRGMLRRLLAVPGGCP